MKNEKTYAKKYLKDGVDVEELTDKFNDWNLSNSNVTNYGEALYRFLQAEVKPTLTEDEKIILRNIDKIYVEICRNESGYLCLLELRETGTKFDDTFACYNHLFQFIQPRRRI